MAARASRTRSDTTTDVAAPVKLCERDLLARAKRERAGLRIVWEQALDALPARRQARLAIELSKIVPVRIRNKPAAVDAGGPAMVPCEKPFELNRRERQELAARMLREGAKRSEILATVEISPSTLLKVARANGKGHERAGFAGDFRLSHAVTNAISGEPCVRHQENKNDAYEKGDPLPSHNSFGDPVPPYLPPDQRGPAPIALSASGTDPEAEERFWALMAHPDELPRMTQAEAEGRRPDWHRWVYGAARNPIHEIRPRPRS